MKFAGGQHGGSPRSSAGATSASFTLAASASCLHRFFTSAPCVSSGLRRFDRRRSPASSMGPQAERWTRLQPALMTAPRHSAGEKMVPSFRSRHAKNSGNAEPCRRQSDTAPTSTPSPTKKTVKSIWLLFDGSQPARPTSCVFSASWSLVGLCIDVERMSLQCVDVCVCLCGLWVSVYIMKVYGRPQ